MNKYIISVIGILIGLVLIPVVINMIDNIRYEDTDFNFIAVSNTSTAEIFDLDNEDLIPLNITFVSVNGVEISSSEYNYSDIQDLVQLDAISSDIGDVIVITNTVELDTDHSMFYVMEIIPTLLLISMLSGLLMYTLKNKKY